MESSNVLVDSPASAAAIRYLANYFGMGELFRNVNSTFVSINMTNETVVDYVHESIRFGDENLGKAATRFLIKAIANGSLQWTKALISLPLSTLFEIATKVKKNPNFGQIVIEYINSDVQQRVLSSKNVACLLHNLCPQFIDTCPLEILQVVERYHLPANHRTRRACVSAIGKAWWDQPYLRGSKLARVSSSGAGGSYAALSDGQKVEILEKSLQCAYDDREVQQGRIQRLEESLQAVSNDRDIQRRLMEELRPRTNALELAPGKDTKETVVTEEESKETFDEDLTGGASESGNPWRAYDGSNLATTPNTMPEDRPAYGEVGVIVTLTTLAAGLRSFTRATFSKTMACMVCHYGGPMPESHFTDYTANFNKIGRDTKYGGFR
jgi:hypothetical protein